MVVTQKKRSVEINYIGIGMWGVHHNVDWIMFISVVLLGIIEGITEFLPISSTGHLIIVSNWLAMDADFSATFNIAIQLGAIMAVVWEYPSSFKAYMSSWNRMLIMGIAIGPALVLGALFHSAIKSWLFSPETVYVALIIGGVALIIADQVYKRRRLDPADETKDETNTISMRQALIVGVFQCAALWPGMSRSGSTIIGGLLAGTNMKSSAKFSFLIAVPVMVAAVGYDLIQNVFRLTAEDIGWILVGFLVSFVVALMSIRWFLAIIQRVGLSVFGIYRIGLGLIGLLVLVK